MKISKTAFFIIMLLPAGLQPSFSKECRIVTDTIRPSYYSRWVPLDWAIPVEDNDEISSRFTIYEIGRRIYLVNNYYQNRIFYYDGNRIIPFSISIPFDIRYIYPLNDDQLLLISKDTAVIMDRNGQTTPSQSARFLQSILAEDHSIKLIRPMPDSTYLILTKSGLFLTRADGQIIWKNHQDNILITLRNDYQLPSGDCLIVTNRQLYLFSLNERKLNLLPFDNIRDIFEWNGKIMILHNQSQISEFKDNQLIPYPLSFPDETIIRIVPIDNDKLAFQTRNKLYLLNKGRLEVLLDQNRTSVSINSIYADSHSILYVATDQGMLVFPYLDIENYPIEMDRIGFNDITLFQDDNPDHWIFFYFKQIIEYSDHRLILFKLEDDSNYQSFSGIYPTQDYLIISSRRHLLARKKNADSFRLIPCSELKSGILVTDYQDCILVFNLKESLAYRLDPIRLTITPWPESGIRCMIQLDSIHYLINDQIIYNSKSQQSKIINNPSQLVFSRSKLISPDCQDLFLIDDHDQLYITRDRELHPLAFLQDKQTNQMFFSCTRPWLISNSIYRLSDTQYPFNLMILFFELKNGKPEPLYQKTPPIFTTKQTKPNYFYRSLGIPETGEHYISHQDTVFRLEPNPPYQVQSCIIPHPIFGIGTPDSGQTLSLITNFGVYHYDTRQHRLTGDSINTMLPFNFKIVRHIDQNLYRSPGATIILDGQKPYIVRYPVIAGNELITVRAGRNQKSYWLMNQGISIIPDRFFQSRIPAPDCRLDSVTLEPEHERIELDSKLSSSVKNLIFHFSIDSRHYPYEIYYSLDRENWSRCESGNRIILNNLNPGRYQLRIIIAGNNHIRQSQDLIYRFEIDKYWWTKWEYLSFILAMMIGIFYAIGYVIYRNRLQQSRIRMELDSAGRMNEILQQHNMTGSLNLQIDIYSKPFFLIGGDFYESIPLGKDKTMIIIGDVSGHGLDTSLMMATIKGTLAGLTTPHVSSRITPDELNRLIFNELNRIILENPHWDKYLTLLITQFDFKARICRLVSAGHPQPIYVSSEKQKAEIINLCNTFPIGWTKALEYHETQLHFQKDDLLFLYTDGLINLTHPNYPAMDEKGLADTIQTMISSRRTEAYKEYLTELFKSYQNHDDQTMLMIRIK